MLSRLKKENKSIIFIKIDNQTIDFEIKDLNIYNILASLAVLKVLKINFSKIKNKFKNQGHLKEEVKNILFLDIRKNLN